MFVKPWRFTKSAKRSETTIRVCSHGATRWSQLIAAVYGEVKVNPPGTALDRVLTGIEWKAQFRATAQSTATSDAAPAAYPLTKENEGRLRWTRNDGWPHVRRRHHLPPADQVPETCALDVADRGGVTLADVGQLLNVTRQRIEQLTNAALARVAGRVEDAHHGSDSSRPSAAVGVRHRPAGAQPAARQPPEGGGPAVDG